MEAPRISPEDARERVAAGRALFVCAYEDETRCKSNNLEGAVTFEEFRRRLPALSKDHEIIFYCA